MKSRKGFTLIELMIVVLIVAVLAAVLVPMMRARLDAAKWSEARAGMGNIASGIRAYWAEHQDQAGTGDWVNPVIADVCLTRAGGGATGVGDLDGKYFSEECYLGGTSLVIGTVDAEQRNVYEDHEGRNKQYSYIQRQQTPVGRVSSRRHGQIGNRAQLSPEDTQPGRPPRNSSPR